MAENAISALAELSSPMTSVMRRHYQLIFGNVVDGLAPPAAAALHATASSLSMGLEQHSPDLFRGPTA